LQFPLQSLSQFNITKYEDNPRHTIAFIIGLVVVVAIFIFLNVSKTVKNSRVFRTGEIGHFKPNPERTALNKVTAEYELKSDEISYIKDLTKTLRVDTLTILKNPEMLDNIFKSRYKELAKKEPSKEILYETALLFKIRNVIAYFDNNRKLGLENKNFYPRSSTRKDSNFYCTCYAVETITEKKKIKKLLLSSTLWRGEATNISTGGCTIMPVEKIYTKKMIKIEFFIGQKKISALGEVLRINKSAKGIFLHIKFLKVQPRSLTIINAYIFDYE
jgi:hypothetical protein